MNSSYQHIAVSEERGALVVAISIDKISTWDVAQTLRQEMASALESAAIKQVVIDMSQLSYLSSVGYGPFVTFRKAVEDASGKVVMCGMSDFVKELFEKTRLLINPKSPASSFEWTDTREQAFAKLTETL